MATPRNIILTGFMGTGKTAVGRRLARKLDWVFVDTDSLIEDKAGMEISRIFEERGEAGFRAIEREVVEGLTGLERHVVATGGGVPLSESNRRALHEAGAVVLLEASEEAIWARVSHATHRPLLAGTDPRGRIRKLLAERAPIYATIGLRVCTDEKAIDEIAGEVMAALDLTENR